MAEDFAQRKSV